MPKETDMIKKLIFTPETKRFKQDNNRLISI